MNKLIIFLTFFFLPNNAMDITQEEQAKAIAEAETQLKIKLQKPQKITTTDKGLTLDFGQNITMKIKKLSDKHHHLSIMYCQEEPMQERGHIIQKYHKALLAMHAEKTCIISNTRGSFPIVSIEVYKAAHAFEQQLTCIRQPLICKSCKSNAFA